MSSSIVHHLIIHFKDGSRYENQYNSWESLIRVCERLSDGPNVRLVEWTRTETQSERQSATTPSPIVTQLKKGVRSLSPPDRAEVTPLFNLPGSGERVIEDGLELYVGGTAPRIAGRVPSYPRPPVRIIQERIGSAHSRSSPIRGVNIGRRQRRAVTLGDVIERVLLRGWMDLEEITLHISWMSQREVEEEIGLLIDSSRLLREWRVDHPDAFDASLRGHWVYSLNPDWKPERDEIDPRTGLDISQSDNEFDD